MTNHQECEHYFMFKDPLTSKCKKCGEERDNGVMHFLQRKILEERSSGN